MPDPRNLTEPLIRNLKPATAGQRYAVADAVVPGLKVRVTDKGAKSFVLWRRYPGAKNSAAARSLGKVGELTLADARTKARAWLSLLAQGKDPSVEDVASVTTCNQAGAVCASLTARCALPAHRALFRHQTSLEMTPSANKAR